MYDLPFFKQKREIMCLNQVCFFLQNGGGREIMRLNHPWPTFLLILGWALHSFTGAGRCV